MVLGIDNTSDVLIEHSFNLFTYFVRELCMHILLEKPAILSYEELGGLSDPGPRDCVHNVV
jgi:hypothetical protein